MQGKQRLLRIGGVKAGVKKAVGLRGEKLLEISRG